MKTEIMLMLVAVPVLFIAVVPVQRRCYRWIRERAVILGKHVPRDSFVMTSPLGAFLIVVFALPFGVLSAACEVAASAASTSVQEYKGMAIWEALWFFIATAMSFQTARSAWHAVLALQWRRTDGK